MSFGCECPCVAWRYMNKDGRNGMAGAWCDFRRRSVACRAVLFAFILTAGIFPGLGPVWAAETVEYRLGPGDRLRLVVFGHEDLSGEFEVKGSGHVSLPLVREVKAQGLTLRQLEQAVIEGPER